MSSHAHHPFEVRIATTEAELTQACTVRKAAYGHHLGDQAVSGFSAVEPLDRAPGTVVLLCLDKASGEVLGTARINIGDEAHALLIERHVILPRSVASRQRAEVTRLAVLPGASSLVKLCLMKAVYHCCLARGIDWLVIAARNDALGRAYRSLGFKDFLAPGQMMPLAYAGNLPHYIFTMDVQGAEPAWRESGHRLLGFMMDTSLQDLPDFRLTPRPAVASRSRAWVA